ncbi:MAG: acyltransferase [Pseudomonas sp.]|nr:acyltransferase [Pseudomonas sp.]
MPTPHKQILIYRPEIDGLRAIAVLAVIFFHAKFKGFSGGFIGVDIFFVISGYLITSIIVAELQAKRFSLLTFYERRARRILPALFVMMLVCVPLAWIYLDAPDLRGFCKSLIAVPTFSSNILFWKETGYFDTTSELKPLLHTWTLAVEEQYYLLFPLFLMASWKLGLKRIALLLAVVAAAGLFMAQQGATNDSAAVFYLLPTRAWELLVGSFIAFHFARRVRPRVVGSNPLFWINQTASIAGVLLIGYALFAFDENTAYPGVNALFPTLGAALIIAFARPQTLVCRVLSQGAVVRVGLISYSAYLWHHPVFAFARNISIVEPSVLTMFMLCVLSLALAYLSWRFVEQPFRNKNTFNRVQILKLSASGSMLLIGIGLVGYLNNGFENRFSGDATISTSFAEPTLRDHCDTHYDGKGWDIDFCLFGDPLKSSSPDIAVFGDSHAEALLPAFDSAGKNTGQSVAHIGLGGCPPLLGVDVARGSYDAGVCENLAEREFEYVKQHHIKRVFLVSRWTLYTDGDDNRARKIGNFLVAKGHQDTTRETSRAVFEDGLATTLDAYKAIGAQVYIVEQVPQQLVTPKNIYYRLSSDRSLSTTQKLALVRTVSVPKQHNDELQRFTRQLFDADSAVYHINLIVLDDAFCQNDVCLLGDTHSYYKDYNHLNQRGATLLTGKITEILSGKS